MRVWNGWTHAKVASLKKLWAEGVRVDRIAKRLGCSKNAVIGKADRLKLGPHPVRYPVLNEKLNEAVELVIERGVRPCDAARATGAGYQSLTATLCKRRRASTERAA